MAYKVQRDKDIWEITTVVSITTENAKSALLVLPATPRAGQGIVAD